MKEFFKGGESGFTLIEIIVALLIMVIGFLAMSQMQYLSLRQHMLADSGTVGTNYLQALSERDMAEVRRFHLLNSRAYLVAQSGAVPNLQYCSGGQDAACDSCPCDPMEVLTTNTGATNTESSCASISKKDFDPADVDYGTSHEDCTGGDLYLVRRVETTVDTVSIPNIIEVNITYAIKTPQQFANYNFGDAEITIPSSVVVQNYSTSAHIDNWSNFIAGWNEVRVPHTP